MAFCALMHARFLGSLLEPHGEVRVVKYRADHGGFKSEVSRHGSSHGHGGGLGATIGSGPSHDLGSHGLGVSASAPVAAPVHAVHIPAHIPKQSIPIHEDNEEGNQWSAIEDPKKGGHPLRSQALEEIPAPVSLVPLNEDARVKRVKVRRGGV